MSTKKERTGYRSPKNGNLGVYTLCSGPDPSGPIPGERLIIAIYDKDDNIARRLEQVKGKCIDGGHVDYFLSSNCRPAVYEFHMVDFDAAGNESILATHTSPAEANRWLQLNVPIWVQSHGIEQ